MCRGITVMRAWSVRGLGTVLLGIQPLAQDIDRLYVHGPTGAPIRGNVRHLGRRPAAMLPQPLLIIAQGRSHRCQLMLRQCHTAS